jgi:hypothetical protein
MGSNPCNPYGHRMTSLHIEHAITDLETWVAAFTSFADARREAGVRAEQVRTPVDDPTFIVVDLEFDTAGEAESFLDFLRSRVWSTPTASPGLAGSPETRILEPVTFD